MWDSIHFKMRDRTAEGLWPPLGGLAPGSHVWALWERVAAVAAGVITSWSHIHALVRVLTAGWKGVLLNTPKDAPRHWCLPLSSGDRWTGTWYLHCLAAGEAAMFEMLGGRSFGMDIGASPADPKGCGWCGEASGSRGDRTGYEVVYQQMWL